MIGFPPQATNDKPLAAAEFHCSIDINEKATEIAEMIKTFTYAEAATTKRIPAAGTRPRPALRRMLAARESVGVRFVLFC
jgi:hypothetical protein